MTKVFRFTDGVTANSISGTPPFPASTPFNTGTARTRPTTRQGIFDEIALALVAAGFTEVQHVANTRHVYKSNGEDTTENWALELNLQSGGQYLHFNVATKVDALDELEGGIGSNVSIGAGQDLDGRWNLGVADFTTDFFILCTKDHLFAFFQAAGSAASTVFWSSVGLGKRSNLFNPNKYTLAADALAGANVTLDVTGSGNPLAEGYRPGEIIGIVETAPAEAVAARRLLVKEVTATGFIVEYLPVDFHIGALVGVQPCPLIRCAGNDNLPDDNTAWSSPLLDQVEWAGSKPATAVPLAQQGELLAYLTLQNGQLIDPVYPGNDAYATSGEFGAGSTPNQRTQRFTCRNLNFISGGEYHSIHPFLVAFPGSVNVYPHDWFKADRLSPIQYFVGFRPTSGTTQRWGVGPTI